MVLLSDRGYEVLSRYKKGRAVQPEDEAILNRYANTGNVAFGFTVVDGQPMETAWLTQAGRDMLHQEGIYRSGPIRRLLHSWANLAWR